METYTQEKQEAFNSFARKMAWDESMRLVGYSLFSQGFDAAAEIMQKRIERLEQTIEQLTQDEWGATMQVFNNNLPSFNVRRPDGTLERRRHIAYTVSFDGKHWKAHSAKNGSLKAVNYISEDALHKTMQGMTERA